MLQAFLAQASTAAPAGPGGIGGGLGGFIVPMTLIFVMMYFLLIRPQKKRQMEQQRLVSALKTGDRVVTNAGMIVKVADNVKIEMEKSAVANVLKEG